MCLANVTIGGSGYIYKEEVVKSATRDTGGGGGLFPQLLIRVHNYDWQ